MDGAHAIGVLHAISEKKLTKWRDPVDSIFAESMLKTLDAAPAKERAQLLADMLSKASHIAAWITKKDNRPSKA